MAYRDSNAPMPIYTSVTNKATNVSTTSAASTTITSISLTPGTWIISGNLTSVNSANTNTQSRLGISTVNNTFQGTIGNQFQANSLAGGNANISITIANFVAVVASNTTYYLIGRQDFASGTGTLNGRITAIRIA